VIIQNGLRNGLSQFKLRAHFLHDRSQRFNLFLLTGYNRFLFYNIGNLRQSGGSYGIVVFRCEKSSFVCGVITSGGTGFC